MSRLAEKTNGLKVGDPNEHDTIIGPVINGDALATIKRRVDDAVRARREGARGRQRRGPVLPPTLLDDVPPDSEFANARDVRAGRRDRDRRLGGGGCRARERDGYGLSSGIITQDTDRGLALAQAIDAGIVHVNDQPVGDEPQMPFGGVKDSGFGRFGGTAVVDEFTELRWVTVQRGSHPFPF